ncbi:MAG: mercuric reductase [Acidobacteria bacterium]|nr:mercuric reductase [Acidobacteriota bacterium]
MVTLETATFKTDDVEVLPRDEHNAQLVRNVHPPDWVSPDPAPRYNLVVLGAGTAGLVTAAGAAALGAKVALIERYLIGGDCLNVGCVPSKAIIRASRVPAEVRDAKRFGTCVPPGVHTDFASVMERMRRIRAGISNHDSAERFRSLGVDVFLGHARFSGPDTVTVAGKTLRYKRAVIATGTRPSIPPIEGLAETGYLTNETVFSLTELPRRLAVIGAGPIGCELAQAFARFSSQVVLIEADKQILIREDLDAARCVESALSRDGVKIICGGKASRVRRRNLEKVIHLECNGQSHELIVDEILIAVGRKPNVQNLNLEAASVRHDPHSGIAVNDRLQTTNRRIYAAGDVCSQYKFTHAADAMARVVIQNSLFGGRKKVSALVVPWCTYTAPELAHVGLSQRDAGSRGIETDCYQIPFSSVDRAVADGEVEGFVKILTKKGTDRILGATIVANHAGEMISEITLAITNSIGLSGIAATIHPYPTQAEAIKKAADAYNRTRLTPFVKKLFDRWLAWTR